MLSMLSKKSERAPASAILGHAGWLFDLQYRVLRLERPADEAVKPAAPVLLIADSLQMFDPLLDSVSTWPNIIVAARISNRGSWRGDLHHFQAIGRC